VEQKTKNWVPVVRWVARIWSLAPVIIALVVIVFSRAEQGVVVLDRLGGAKFACCFSDWVGPGLALATPGGLDLAGGAGCVSDRVFDHC